MVFELCWFVRVLWYGEGATPVLHVNTGSLGTPICKRGLHPTAARRHAAAWQGECDVQMNPV